METVLILVAVAALVGSGVAVAAMAARTRRPPLRLPQEQFIDEIEEAGLMKDLAPTGPSPIDRSGGASDLESIEVPKSLPAPRPLVEIRAESGKNPAAGDAAAR